MLAAIVIIIAVKIAHLAVAPAAIIWIELAIVVAQSSEARSPSFVAAVRRFRPIIIVIAERAFAGAVTARCEELVGLVSAGPP